MVIEPPHVVTHEGPEEEFPYPGGLPLSGEGPAAHRYPRAHERHRGVDEKVDHQVSGALRQWVLGLRYVYTGIKLY